MKPTTAIEGSVESTLTGETIRMGIASGAEEFVVRAVTDLYEHPTYAIVREYSTNARDAHIEAGIDLPIEVTLPTSINPYLKIRDYGVGMDEERLRENYAQYGGSTKRDTDELQGFLGFGCKSALAYTEMFTVVSVRDNRKIIAVIERLNEGELPTMRIVSKEPTGERNGTEIQIVVNGYWDVSQVKKWAEHHFRFWEKGTVLVDGEAPKHIGGLRLNDRLLVTQETAGNDYLVMGNVAYPAKINTDLSDSYGLVAFVDIGEMDFAPSREAPRMSARTIDCIARVEEQFAEGIRAAIQRDVDKAQNKPDALRVAVDWRKVFGSGFKGLDLTYKGHKVPSQFDFGFVKVPHPLERGKTINQEISATFTDHDEEPLKKHSTHKSTMPGTLLDGALVVGYDLADFTSAHKRKLRMWAADKGVDVNTFVLVVAPLPRNQQSWLPKDRIVDWNTVAAYKLPRKLSQKNANRVSGTFEVATYIDEKYTNYKVNENIDADTIAEYDYVFWTDKFAFSERPWRGAGLLLSYRKNGCIVFLAQNRINKFLRGFPKAKYVHDALAEIYRRTAAQVTPQDRRIYALQQSGTLRQHLKVIDPERIIDPDILALRELLDTPMGNAAEQLMKFSNVRAWLDVKSPFESEIAQNDPFDKYPLFCYDDYYSKRDFKRLPEEMYIYINAKYQALCLEGEKEIS